jgi:hypothetical protein
MDMEVIHHVSGKRIQTLAIQSNSFIEERFLTALFNSIRSGGRVEIYQGRKIAEDGEPEEMLGDLLEEEAHVVQFRQYPAADE